MKMKMIQNVKCIEYEYEYKMKKSKIINNMKIILK